MHRSLITSLCKIAAEAGNFYVTTSRDGSLIVWSAIVSVCLEYRVSHAEFGIGSRTRENAARGKLLDNERHLPSSDKETRDSRLPPLFADLRLLKFRTRRICSRSRRYCPLPRVLEIAKTTRYGSCCPRRHLRTCPPICLFFRDDDRQMT